MHEVLKENFEEVFVNIENDFQDAAFFAIDNEFSGLLASEKLSSFDTMEERFLEQVKCMKDFVSLQIGIAAFHFCEETNTYNASTYCFYIFPQPFGALDPHFLCMSSSFEFLCQYGFDFNKLVHHGIPYLSHYDEEKLRKAMDNGELLRNLDTYLSIEDRNKIQDLCSEISVKIASLKPSNCEANSNPNKKSNPTEINCIEDLKIELAPLLAFAAYHEIHHRFPDIIINPENYGMRLVLNPVTGNSSEDRATEEIFKKRIIDSLKGFTRVFDLLIDLKKPIVGHNMFSDLLMMCKQFHGPSPMTLQGFKSEVHKLFPTVYDTKFFCQEIKRRHRSHLKRENVWQKSSLQGLYDYFQGFAGDKYKIPCPSILQSVGISAEGLYHNAGWDSYCAGHIFIRMIHLHAAISGEMEYKGEIPTSEDYLSIAKQYSNRVNVIKGNIFYIVLDDKDPESHRPTHLFVQSRNKTVLNIEKVARLCSSFGTTDVKPIDKFTALIGIGSRPGYRRIMRSLRNHPDFKIERYSIVRHNPIVRITLWTTCAILTCASGVLLLKILPQLKK